MLHLHALVWLEGNLAFSTLRQRVLQDKAFADRMIHYLETIIVQSIDFITAKASTDLPNTPPSAKGPETDAEFHAKLSADSNIIACEKQIYSPNHNATCFKY